MSKIKIYEAGEQLNRIANALEEVLRLVKQDQEDAKKRMLAAADEGLKEHQETDELSKEWRVWVENIIESPGQQWPAFTCSTRAG